MTLTPLLSAEKIAANMAEIHPPLREQEARAEADRCLYCFDAPCIAACPTGIDVPAFIKKIASGNDTGAARVILSANILGASCARVCPTQVLCEGACVLLDRDRRPIEIGRLQRHATDHAERLGVPVLTPPAALRDEKVAVIGAGPAGLGCAAELAQLGYHVTIFEKDALPGGLNTHGIALYKMTPQFSLREIEWVRGLGVEIRCGVEVGRDVPVSSLEQEFKALFVGVGLGEGNRLGIPGEDLPEVVDALAFIRRLHREPLERVPVGRRVVVIGCGNTAIDAVTQAIRLGAERTSVIYRRGETDMTAYDFEYAHARHDGAAFHFHAMPLEILQRDGHVDGVRLARTRETSAGVIEIIPGTEWIEQCDMVLKAVGQRKQVPLLKRLFPAIQLDDRGAVIVDPLTGATNLRHVFAGGDCANGGREVVNAVGEGKKAARGIHARLGGTQVAPPPQPSRQGAADGGAGSGLLRPVRAHELEAAMAREPRGRGKASPHG